MKITTLGIDLAKNVFQLHGVDEFGKTVVKKQLRRYQVSEYFVSAHLTTPFPGRSELGMLMSM